MQEKMCKMEKFIEIRDHFKRNKIGFRFLLHFMGCYPIPSPSTLEGSKKICTPQFKVKFFVCPKCEGLYEEIRVVKNICFNCYHRDWQKKRLRKEPGKV